MKGYLKCVVAILFLFSFFFIFHLASAHEVYVLDGQEINVALQSPTPDFTSSIKDHFGQFVTWGIGITILLLATFFLSFNSFLRKYISPYLIYLKKSAPIVSQLFLGLAVLAAGYFHALFGIEIPFMEVFGSQENLIAILFMLLGAMLILGIFPRISALFLSFIFLLATYHLGLYMLTYLLYFGEALTILIFGGAYSLHGHQFVSHHFSKRLHIMHHDYKFLIIRITFGISLIYASMYAKFFHGDLALETINKFHLTNYFHFDPLFLVLGAMLTEVLIGILFGFGVLVRLASVFFLIMLTLSLIFFGETVWPHLILIGTALVMFLHGYDRYTLMGWIQRDKLLEPVI